MKCERVWYACDYCEKDLNKFGLVTSQGYGGIRDDNFNSSRNTIDICDDIECYHKHIDNVKQRMKNDKDNSFMLYPLDRLNIKQGTEYKSTENSKIKVKWNESDQWHTYKKDTLIKLLIPLYEKYCIVGNEKYIK